MFHLFSPRNISVVIDIYTFSISILMISVGLAALANEILPTTYSTTLQWQIQEFGRGGGGEGVTGGHFLPYHTHL